jgi:hypothetical protein
MNSTISTRTQYSNNLPKSICENFIRFQNGVGGGYFVLTNGELYYKKVGPKGEARGQLKKAEPKREARGQLTPPISKNSSFNQKIVQPLTCDSPQKLSIVTSMK